MYVNKWSYCYLCSESRIKGKGERKEGVREREVRCRNAGRTWEIKGKESGALPREEVTDWRIVKPNHQVTPQPP